MTPGDRLVCALVRPAKVGDTFHDWVLHVTVVPWFRLEEPSETIATGLTRALTAIAPFEARVAEEAWFGPKKNRQAHVLATPSPFFAVEEKVRTYLHKKRAWLVDETTKKQRQFRPHVTAQKNDALQVGDTLQVEKLFIIEQKGAHKEVVAEVKLG